jgi:hypothetical protein
MIEEHQQWFLTDLLMMVRCFTRMPRRTNRATPLETHGFVGWVMCAFEISHTLLFSKILVNFRSRVAAMHRVYIVLTTHSNSNNNDTQIAHNVHIHCVQLNPVLLFYQTTWHMEI